MGSALVRQWLVLSLLPKPPRRVDAATLERHLRARGVRVHRRTIQRDLVELSAVFPIVADERSKPYGWRWKEGAAPFCAMPVLPTGGVGKAIGLRLRVARAAARGVVEGLRGRDGARREVAVVERGPHVEVSAEIDAAGGVERWLLALGDAVEVLAPADLRADVAATLARALAFYRSSA